MGLWPTCKTTRASSQVHCLEPFASKLREHQRITTPTWPLGCELLLPVGRCPRHHNCRAPSGFPKLLSSHSMCRGRFCMRPLSVQPTREMYKRRLKSLGSSLRTSGILQGQRSWWVPLFTSCSTSIGWVGALFRFSGLPWVNFSQSKGSRQISRVLLHVCVFPTCNLSSSVDQCPVRLRRLLGSYRPATTTWHTHPTQNPLVHKATFPRLEVTVICVYFI